MTLFRKTYKCPKCGQTVEILNKGNSHAFFCDECMYPLYWNAKTRAVETDTLRSKQAHQQWSRATRCPKCRKVVEVRNRADSHAFFCDHCHAPVYWNAPARRIEADTRQAEQAHEQWRRKGARSAAKTAAGSGCVLPVMFLLAAAGLWALF